MTQRLIKCFALVLLLSPLTFGASAAPTTRSSVYKQLDLLVDIRHEIVSQYVEEPDQPKMVQSAVRAMVESLNDPYTIYISPEELAPFDKQIRGTFSGIGAEVDIFENRLRIISPLDESPAWKAGVMAGDIVLEIDGVSTLNLKINEAIQKLMGPEGAPVKLKLHHTTGEEKEVTINRARINVQTVKGIRRKADSHWDFMLDPANKIGYIRLTQFTEKSIEDFRAALKALEEQGVKGLILDLRFDPGGLLEAAVAISDVFLEKGQRIVSVKGRVVPERITYATDGPKFPNVPLVVIANESSASASEVVTGALSDNNRALFVGTRTFGKGSVQQVMALDNDEGAIKITNAYYYLPNGRNIHQREGSEVWGVDPSEGCYVPMSSEQIRKMIELRRDADVLRNGAAKVEPGSITPDAIEKDMADPQLAAAVRAVLGKQSTGTWPKVGQSNAAMLAKATKRDTLSRQRDQLKQRLTEIEASLAKLDGVTTQPAPKELPGGAVELKPAAAAPPASPVAPADSAPKPAAATPAETK